MNQLLEAATVESLKNELVIDDEADSDQAVLWIQLINRAINQSIHEKIKQSINQ